MSTFTLSFHFTLIEIIISIGLIVLIGGTVTTVTFVNNNKKEQKTLEDNAIKFEEALQVYLETNTEVIKNVNKNAKGAIVTLEVLKNEGLIKDDLDIDYKKKYYLLSNAVLAPAGTNTDCDADQVELAVVESWNVDTDKVVYVCSNGNTYDDTDLQDRTAALENAIIEINETLDSYIITQNNKKTTFTGNDANNYVKFPVIGGNANNDLLYFEDNSDKNLWRIYDYYGIDGSPKSMKLVYHTNVNTRERLNVNDWSKQSGSYVLVSDSSDYNFRVKSNSKYTYYKILSGDVYKTKMCSDDCGDWCTTRYYKIGDDYYASYDDKTVKNSSTTYTILNKKLDNWDSTTTYCKPTSDSSSYYKYTYDNGITSTELENDDNFTALYNKLQYKDWVKDNTYYIEYPNFSINLTKKITRKVGIITSSEIISTKSNNISWLLDIMEGKVLGKVSKSFDNGLGYLNASFSLKGQMNTDCDGGLCDKGALEYVPVVTLKQGVKFIKDSSCSDTQTPGSKQCPYLLEYNGTKAT